MARIKLETHEIEIRKKGHPNEAPLNLWNIDGNGLTLPQLFLQYITWLEGKSYADETTKKVFAFDSSKTDLKEGQYFLAGRFEYGEFGVANSIKNVRTRKETHPKTREEAEVYPLYFLVYTPKDESRAVLVLQRYGVVAMLTILKHSLIQFAAEKYDLKVKIEPLTPIEVIREYIRKGSVEEITLRRTDIPHDESERLRAGGLKNNPKTITVKLTGSGLIEHAMLYRWLDNEKAVFVVPQLAEVGLDGEHRTTVKINVNGTIREIDFSDTGKIRPYIDIHDEELLEKDSGHPIFEQINRIAKRYAQDILKPGIHQDQP